MTNEIKKTRKYTLVHFLKYLIIIAAPYSVGLGKYFINDFDAKYLIFLGRLL